MQTIFPAPVLALPPADIPIDGASAYLSQSDSHQIIFMAFAQDADLPEHAHAAQIGFVLEGRIDLVIGACRAPAKRATGMTSPTACRTRAKSTRATPTSPFSRSRTGTHRSRKPVRQRPKRQRGETICQL